MDNVSTILGTMTDEQLGATFLLSAATSLTGMMAQIAKGYELLHEDFSLGVMAPLGPELRAAFERLEAAHRDFATQYLRATEERGLPLVSPGKGPPR